MKWLKKFFGGGDAAPAAVSTATLRKEAGGLYVFTISGVLSKPSLDKAQGIIAQDIERGAENLKVLTILKDFRGWRQGQDWGDLNFFEMYEKNIARVAVVCDLRWEAETMTFLGGDLRSGEARCFGPQDEAKARAWLAERV